MNKDVLIDAGIDFNAGEERFSGHTEIYLKYLRRFPEDTYYPALLKSLEDGDTQNAFVNAHSLKGTVGNLSLTALYTVVSEMVEALRAGDLEKARSMVPQITEAYNNTIEVLTSGALDD